MSFAHRLIANLSGLIAVVTFMAKLWGRTTISHALVVAAGLGIAFYVSVGLAYAATRRIVTQPSGSAGDRETPSPEENASEETVAEGQASE